MDWPLTHKKNSVVQRVTNFKTDANMIALAYHQSL